MQLEPSGDAREAPLCPFLANDFRGAVACSLGSCRTLSVSLASYHPASFCRLLSLSLELCAEQMLWGPGETGEAGSVVSERKEAK